MSVFMFWLSFVDGDFVSDERSCGCVFIEDMIESDDGEWILKVYKCIFSGEWMFMELQSLGVELVLV
jgi:hypothetical protein